jgi:hypothetical protein
MGVYMNILGTVLFPVSYMPLACYRKLWFQQNGVSPHFAIVVCPFLMKWIRRGATTEWPAKSLNITQLDLFLWGHATMSVLQFCRLKFSCLQQLRKSKLKTNLNIY